mmetsp:Transcript_140682/g.258937  ORF Transcript_140682/g.258937 Transcript_140682/m.258937 type:complete len:149 (+) Transcript_140682:3-449(+)
MWPFPSIWYPDQPYYEIRVSRERMKEAYTYGPVEAGLGRFSSNLWRISDRNYRVNRLSTGIQISVRSSGTVYYFSVVCFVLFLITVQTGAVGGGSAVAWYVDTFCKDEYHKKVAELQKTASQELRQRIQNQKTKEEGLEILKRHASFA